jgi:hypothetical protein
MKKTGESNNWQTVLFPHSHLGEQGLKKILPVFGPLSIFQPWFMTPPGFMSLKDYQGAVSILTPPSHMKPEEDFKGLLSEYKTWINHHRDLSTASSIKVGRDMGPTEESSWEIRGSLRESTQGRSGSVGPRQEKEEPLSLKWHLILHLARDMEEERQEADRMLRGLKERKSPIEDLLGEEGVKNPLTDLSRFESDPGAVSYPLEQVFEAWFGLFGAYLKEGDPLLTISREVMDYASESWDTSVRESGGEHAPLIRFEYPDLSDENDWAGLVGFDEKASRDDKVGELRALLRGLGKGHESDLSRLKEHSNEVDAIFQKELMEKPLDVTMKYFSPFSNQTVLEDNRTLKNFSGKVLILVEREGQID